METGYREAFRTFAFTKQPLQVKLVALQITQSLGTFYCAVSDPGASHGRVEHIITRDSPHLKRNNRSVEAKVQETPPSLETCLGFENLESKSVANASTTIVVEPTRIDIATESKNSTSRGA
jgi:hypothetical protein